MVRSEIHTFDQTSESISPLDDTFFQLGVMYATGRDVESDLVTAHKWFNLAAHRGNSEAARYRQELANEMSSGQIADAQRLAREYLRTQH